MTAYTQFALERAYNQNYCNPIRQIESAFCWTRDLKTLKWMHHRFQITKVNHKDMIKEAFSNSCYDADSPEIAKWLCQTFSLSLRDFRPPMARPLITTGIWISLATCSRSTLEWFVETFHPSTDGVLPYIPGGLSNPIQIACSQGRVETAKWFLENFPVDINVLRPVINDAIEHACNQGDILAAKWWTTLLN